MLQQQRSMYLFKFHKAYNTLCPANNYSANLDRTNIINKRVIKLHIKKKKNKKEIQKHTERKTPHTNSSTGFLPIKKKTNIATRGKCNVSG